MRILLGCEESQAVCIEMRKRGHEAYSCDILPCSGGHPEWHIQDDVLKHLDDGWDMMIGFPPCTYLTVTANKYFLNNPERWKKRLRAILFVHKLMNANIEKIAIENPIGVISSHIRKPEQIIQPYYFGDNYKKSTCLWLKNLQPLFYAETSDLFNEKTSVEPVFYEYNSKKSKSGKSKYSKFGKLGKGCGKERSVTPPRLAKAMAKQWTEDLIKGEHNEKKNVSNIR